MDGILMRPMIQSVLQTAGTFYYGRSMNCTALETFIVKCIKTVTSFASHVHVVDWFIDGSGFGHVCENKSANSTVHEDLFAWLYSRTNDTCAWIGKTIKNANCILNERTISKKKVRNFFIVQNNLRNRKPYNDRLVCVTILLLSYSISIQF